MAEIDIFDNSEGQLPQDLGDDVVQEVLKTGTDLRQYSRQIEKELKEVENKSIQDYIKESQNIASLHNQIAACDNILEVRVLLLTLEPVCNTKYQLYCRGSLFHCPFTENGINADEFSNGSRKHQLRDTLPAT